MHPVMDQEAVDAVKIASKNSNASEMCSLQKAQECIPELSQ